MNIDNDKISFKAFPPLPFNPSNIGMCSIHGNSPIISNCGCLKPSESKVEKMSLCYALLYQREAYIAVDSRLSVNVIRDEFGKVVDMDVGTDDFQKIYIINDKNIAFITGQSIFGYDDKTFTDVMSDIDFAGLTLKDILNRLNAVFANLVNADQRTEISVFSMDGGELKLGELIVGYSAFIYDYVFFPKTACMYHLKGVEWARPLIMKVDGRNNTEYIINFYKEAYDQRKYNDNSIGGPIRIIHLTPNGYEWIEKGLIIE